MQPWQIRICVGLFKRARDFLQPYWLTLWRGANKAWERNCRDFLQLYWLTLSPHSLHHPTRIHLPTPTRCIASSPNSLHVATISLSHSSLNKNQTNTS